MKSLLSNQYHHLTAKERFRLVLAAGDRGDGAEIDRLTQTGGQELRSVSDHPRFSRAFIDQERRELPAFWFDQEYGCQFRETIDSVFAADDIHAALSADVAPLFPLEVA